MFLKRIQNDVDLLGRATVKSHWGAPEKDDKNGGGQSERLNLSLRSRRLEVMGTKKTERARDALAREEGALSLRISSSRGLFFLYFQAPATQASSTLSNKILKNAWHE